MNKGKSLLPLPLKVQKVELVVTNVGNGPQSYMEKTNRQRSGTCPHLGERRTRVIVPIDTTDRIVKGIQQQVKYWNGMM
jgi:hypothetical protein